MGATDLYIELFSHAASQGGGGGGVTDHGALTSIGLNTHAQVDNHIADGSIHGGGGATDHTALTNIGTNTHAQLDGHVADTAIHFNEASIDHDAIQNNGTNTHAQVDAHLADATVHFTEASIQHNEIQGAGANTHVSIDAHIANLNIHLKNNTAAVDPTAIDDSSLGYSVFSQWINSDTSKVFICDQTTVGSAVWIDVTATGAAGVTDHAALANIGTNSHADIDTALAASLAHQGDATVHFIADSIDYPYDIVARTDGAIKAGETLLWYYAPRQFTLNVGIVVYLSLDVAATSAMSFDLSDDGTVVASGAIAAGATTGTMTAAGPIVIVTLSALTVVQSGAVDDATASGMLVAIKGVA